MDPNVANAANAAALSTGQLWLLAASMFGTLVTTAAMLWKTSADQRHQIRLIELQHVADKATREAEAANLAASVAASAIDVRDRMEATAQRLQAHVDTTARDVRGRVEATAKDVRDRLEVGVVAVSTSATAALGDQTQSLYRHIDAAKVFTAEKADKAYHEANNVNVKLEKLHEAHDRQGKILEQLLAALRTGTAAAAAGVPPAGPGAGLDVVAVPARGKAAAAGVPPPGSGAAPVAE